MGVQFISNIYIEWYSFASIKIEIMKSSGCKLYDITLIHNKLWIAITMNYVVYETL